MPTNGHLDKCNCPTGISGKRCQVAPKPTLPPTSKPVILTDKPIEPMTNKPVIITDKPDLKPVTTAIPDIPEPVKTETPIEEPIEKSGPSTEEKRGDYNHSKGGAAAGAVIGTLVAIGAIIGGAYYYRKRRPFGSTTSSGLLGSTTVAYKKAEEDVNIDSQFGDIVNITN